MMLDEDSSRHIVQVLRMQTGDELVLANGEGVLLRVQITDAHKKHCQVKTIEVTEHPQPSRRLTLGVALLKNNARVEWLLEKATEMGVHRIVPLLTQRTIRERFRADRMKGILVSAMLQSQQSWLPELAEPVNFDEVFQQSYLSAIPSRYIAHCLPDERKEWLNEPLADQKDTIILIGPEGDFTQQEIELALSNKFQPVILGPNRLRTETAAMAAVAGFYLSRK